MKAAVVTCSNRSARGERADESGALLADGLIELGHEVVSRVVVPDDVDAIRGAVWDALALGAGAVITTGGTGLTPTDVTPEAVEPLLERTVPGIAEALRSAARDRVPTSVLSRGVAGLVGGALVVTLPGSPGGVRDGLAVLGPLLEHAVDQAGGGDHRPGGGMGPAFGTNVSVSAWISDAPIDESQVEAAAARREAGAVVVFRGVVRSSDHGREVTSLEYSAHPTAESVLHEVVSGIAGEPDVLAAAAVHRTGELAIGDLALLAVVACAHRGPAFETCGRFVDEIKRRLPVWKRQVFADGSDEWVNCP